MATARRAGSKRKDKDDATLPRKAARAALDQATATIKRLQKDAIRNYWTIGRRLAQVAGLKLHEARGFTTLVEYAEGVLGLTGGTAFQYMRVATAFSEEVAAAFGVEKLDRALRYIAATPADESPEEIPDLQIDIPGEEGEPARKKRFAEVTIAELRRAVQRVREQRTPRRRGPELPERATEVVSRANKALDRAVGRKRQGGADVTARVKEDGVWIDVRGIPLDLVAAVFRALAVAVK